MSEHKDLDWARLFDPRQSQDVKDQTMMPKEAIVWDWSKPPYRSLANWWLSESFNRSCRLNDPWTQRMWKEAAAMARHTGKRQPKPPMSLWGRSKGHTRPLRSALMTLKPAADKEWAICNKLTKVATDALGRPFTVWMPYNTFNQDKSKPNDCNLYSRTGVKAYVNFTGKLGPHWAQYHAQKEAEAAARQKAEEARQEQLRYKERELAQNKPEGWQRCAHGCGRALAPTWDDAVAYYEHAVGSASECLRCRNARRPGMFPTKRIDR